MALGITRQLVQFDALNPSNWWQIALKRTDP